MKSALDKFFEDAVKAFNELRMAVVNPVLKAVFPKAKYPIYPARYKKVINGGWKKRHKGVRL